MGYSIPPRTALSDLAAELEENHSSVLSGGAPTVEMPASITRSWARSIESDVSADDLTLPVVSSGELAQRRADSPLFLVSGRVQRLFRDAVDDAELLLATVDSDGVLLWRGGSPGVLSSGERLYAVDGANWSEAYASTTAIGLALAEGRTSRLFGAEHFKVPLHSWYCAAAPIHDPRTGELLGAVDLSGPAESMQRSVSAFATTIAALCERELADHHARTLADLAEAASGHLAAASGTALIVDSHGWVAAGRGINPPRSIAPPVAGEQQFVPGIGMCDVDEVGDGWLVRPVGSARSLVAELDLSAEPTLSVIGDDPWCRVLTRRHAQIMLLLADAGPAGLTAANLSRRMFGDEGHVVTVRAEMSRLRRAVGALVSSRPYRLGRGVTLRVTPVEPGPPRTGPDGKHQRPR